MSAMNPRVLVIDRSSGYHRLFHLALEDAYEVEHAYSGFLAEALLREKTFDLVIASLALPREYRGRGILRTIRAVDGCGHMPVVALVAEAERAPAEGDPDFVGCIVDPSNFEDVRRAVQSALMLRHAA